MSQKENEISYAQAAIVMARLEEQGEKITIARLDKIFLGQLSQEVLKQYCQQWHNRKHHHDAQVFPLSSHSGFNQNFEANVDKTVRQRTKELEESLALVRATLESTADGILIISNNGQLVDWNDQFIQIMKTNEETMKRRDEGGGIAKLLSKIEDPEEFVKLMQHVYQNPELEGNMGNLKFKDGRIVERYSKPHKVNNEIVGRVWSFRDITDQVKSQRILKLREKVIESSINGIVIIEAQSPYTITYVNPALERLTHFDKNVLVGKPFNILHHEAQDPSGIERVERAIESQQADVVIIKNYKKNGDIFWNELHISPVPNNDGEITHHVVIMLDITEKKITEQQTLYRANHDFLTDLPNRTFFMSEVEKKFIHYENSQNKMAVLFLDLDNFKFINDRLGHTFGDKILLAVAGMLRKELGANYLLSRFGGDEFVILIENFDTDEILKSLIKRILSTISKTIYVKGHALSTTASAGISIFPDHGTNISDLLICSDIAMYQAKEEGRNRFYIYNNDLRNQIAIKMTLESSLHSALSNNELSLVYQPILDLSNKKIIGAESLIRWQHPELGMVPPDKFIPIAELNGEINPIGLWVLKEACRQYVKWKKLYQLKFIAINISTSQLKMAGFADQVAIAIYQNNINPANIELELTEGIFIDDSKILVDNIVQLKSMGINLSIDDFGTGFSNFAYLKRFKIDKIKIDRSFINKIDKETNNYDKTIPRSMINLGRDLNITVLAEGVEDDFQRDFLIANNCNEAQGYFFGKPMTPEDFESAILKNKKS